MTIQNAIGNLINKATQVVLGNDALGDLYYRGQNGVLARLGIGTAGQILGIPSGQTNPVPGWVSPLGVNWSIVTGTTQAAAVNSGYLISNASLVTITLPATAPVGSLLEIVGMGAGGWRLAQAAGQQVIFSSLSNTLGASGQLVSIPDRD